MNATEYEKSLNKKLMAESEFSELDLLINKRKFQRKPADMIHRDAEVRSRFHDRSRQDDDMRSSTTNNLFSRIQRNRVQQQQTRPVTPRSSMPRPPPRVNMFDNAQSNHMSELKGSLFDFDRKSMPEPRHQQHSRSVLATQEMMNDMDNMFATNNVPQFQNEQAYVEEPIDLSDPENRKLMNITASLLRQPEFKQLGGYMGQNKKLLQQNVINRIRHFQTMGFNPEDGYNPEDHSFEENTDYVFRQEHAKTQRKNRRRLGNYLSIGSLVIDTLNRISGSPMETTDLKKASKDAVERGQFDEYLDDMDSQLRGTVLDSSAANIFSEYMAIMEENHYKQQAKKERNKKAAQQKIKEVAKSKNLMQKIKEDNAKHEQKTNFVGNDNMSVSTVRGRSSVEKKKKKDKLSPMNDHDDVSVVSSNISDIDLGDFPGEAQPLKVPENLKNITSAVTQVGTGIQEHLNEQDEEDREFHNAEIQSRQNLRSLIN